MQKKRALILSNYIKAYKIVITTIAADHCTRTNSHTIDDATMKKLYIADYDGETVKF